MAFNGDGRLALDSSERKLDQFFAIPMFPSRRAMTSVVFGTKFYLPHRQNSPPIICASVICHSQSIDLAQPVQLRNSLEFVCSGKPSTCRLKRSRLQLIEVGLLPIALGHARERRRLSNSSRSIQVTMMMLL